MFRCDWEFSGDGVEHVTDFLFCFLETAVLDGVEEILFSKWFRLEQISDKTWAEIETLGNSFNVLILSLHVDKLKQFN